MGSLNADDDNAPLNHTCTHLNPCFPIFLKAMTSLHLQTMALISNRLPPPPPHPPPSLRANNSNFDEGDPLDEFERTNADFYIQTENIRR